MANNCYNHITLQGSEDAITKLAERLTDTYSKFSYLNGWADYVLGIRDDFEYSFEDDERKDAYYYGSRKFDFDIELESETLTISGDSAWSPLIKFTEELCKVYQLDGSIYYSETNMDFAGEISFSKGTEINRDECSCREMNYKEDINYWIEDMICVLEGADEDEIESDVEEAKSYASEEHIQELLNHLNQIK